MNKLFAKIAALALGATMVVGVGVAVASSGKAVEPVHAAGGTFTKITSINDLTSGKKFLIVSDEDKLAFDGSLSTIDAISNTKSVTISGNSITTDSDFYFTITSKTGGYSIKGSGGYYIGSPAANSNELKSGTSDSYTNTITWDSTNSCFVIRGTNSYLVYNGTSGQTRYRFYKPTTCNNGLGTGLYHKLSLYKEEAAENVDLTDIGLQSTAEVILGESVDLIPVKTPSNANKKTTFTWESLNPTIASVTDGKVKGLAVGTAQIKINATDIGKSAICTVTVNPVPPVPVTHTIADCYSVSTGTSVKFNGVYMGTYGNNPYQGIFFADGEHGIIIYKTSSVPEGWEVGKTVVAVSGQTAFYNGLVQVTNASFETTSATVADPVPYTFLGTETTGDVLSRKSSISGTVTSVTGQTNNAFVTGTDGKVTVDLGDGKTAMIFIKKGVHTAEELAEYSEKFTVGAYVVVTGFLNYYNNATTFKGTYTPGSFQIIVPTIVSTEVYDADAFALDFLSDTDAICSIAKEDHGTELQAAWSDIGAKFTALNYTEKAKVVAADAAAQTDLGKAVARYDYLVAKYGLSQFIEGRTVSPARIPGYINNQNDNTATIIIAVVSVLSLATLCTLIIIKRRKSIEK